MRRIGTIGLMLVLALAVLALAGIPAAEGAGFGACKSTTGGEYTDSACTEYANHPEAGSFEWSPVAEEFTGPNGASFGKTGGAPALTCTGGSTRVEVFGGEKFVYGEATFTGCQSEGHPCKSRFAGNGGEIRSNEVEGALLEHGEKGLGGSEPSGSEAWLQVSSEEGVPLYEFECEALGYFQTTGWISGRLTATDAPAAAYKLVFKPGIAEQGLKTTGCPLPATWQFEECIAKKEAFFVEAAGSNEYETTIGDGEETELRLFPQQAPRVETKPATAVGTNSAELNGDVTANSGFATCGFEYGETEAYGEFATCGADFGFFREPRDIFIGGLTPDKTYHYRIEAEGLGTTNGADSTFTTFESSASGSTSEPTVPAVAEDGSVRAEASGGTGEVTVGLYGASDGGSPILGGVAPYIDVSHSAESTFTSVQFKDCNLNGAKELWWYNESSGWQPVSGAVYSKAPPCITVTVTEKSSPSIAQLTGTRFGGVELGIQEYGKCEPAKKALYADAACTKVAEKRGAISHKGKFEWYWSPRTCFAVKKGFYEDSSCQKRDESAKGKPKGKFEKGTNAFTGSTGVLTLNTPNSPALECTAGTVTGELADEKKSTETITFSECTREGVKCKSQGAGTGTIATNLLEDFTFKEPETTTVFTSISGGLGLPIMAFTCNGMSFSLEGRAQGLTSGDVNAMSTHTETVFAPGGGEQTLILQGALSSEPVTLTVTEGTNGEAMEIDTSPIAHAVTG